MSRKAERIIRAALGGKLRVVSSTKRDSVAGKDIQLLPVPPQSRESIVGTKLGKTALHSSILHQGRGLRSSKGKN